MKVYSRLYFGNSTSAWISPCSAWGMCSDLQKVTHNPPFSLPLSGHIVMNPCFMLCLGYMAKTCGQQKPSLQATRGTRNVLATVGLSLFLWLNAVNLPKFLFIVCSSLKIIFCTKPCWQWWAWNTRPCLVNYYIVSSCFSKRLTTDSNFKNYKFFSEWVSCSRGWPYTQNSYMNSM